MSIWRTVSKEMLPANSIATTWLASSWSVQFVCPSGALLHAMAPRCASCLPLSLRSRPDRGRSLIAASSPSSTNRLRTLATVATLSETASATSRSKSPSSAFNSARARFTVRANGLPRPDVSIRAERSDWVSSTLYWETGMSGTASLKDFTQAYLIFFMIVRLSGNGTKLKPRWDVHSRGYEDWLGCASEALPSVLEG